MAKKISFFLLWCIALIIITPTYITFSDETQDKSFKNALTLIDENNHTAALEILIKIQDNSPEIKHIIANSYTKNEAWEEAAKYYGQTTSPEYVLSNYTTYHLAKCYQFLEDYEKSVQYYQILVNTRTKNVCPKKLRL